MPAARAARAMSWWFSLHECAPWMITIPPHGVALGQPQRVGEVAVEAAVGGPGWGGEAASA